MDLCQDLPLDLWHNLKPMKMMQHTYIKYAGTCKGNPSKEEAFDASQFAEHVVIPHAHTLDALYLVILLVRLSEAQVFKQV